MKNPPKKTKSHKAASRPAARADIFSLRLDTDALATLAGVTPRRVNQLKIEAGLKAGADGRYSAADFLKAHLLYDSPRGEALRARTRQANARALETEQRVRREQRWLLNLDEVRAICEMVLEHASESTQADSSRFFSEYRQTHTELESLEMAHRLYDPLTRLVVHWHNGAQVLLKIIENDHLPRGKRLDEVLSNLIHDLAAAQAADEEKRNATQGA